VKIPSRTRNPISFQSIVLTGGGGKTILRGVQEDGEIIRISRGVSKEEVKNRY
jgi:hypothetical protein